MSDKGQNVIETPSGGGAVAGLGETFSPDLFTGTGNFSVPIAVPAGVNGFQPQLTLGYSTGSGNGVFGQGWAMGIPGVMRKTAKGVPMYDDTDIFILSGAEDLVEIGRFETTENGRTLSARQFRPRTEGLFARILYVVDSENDFWKVTTKDGLTSYYGTPFSRSSSQSGGTLSLSEGGTLSLSKGDPATINDPKNNKKVFAWKLSRTIDTFGNRIDYTYSRSPQGLVTLSGVEGYDQSYLQRIDYMHYTNTAGQETALCQVHFEYQQRPDIFSAYKQGFEVRTTLRCDKIITKTEQDNASAETVMEYDFIYLDEVDDLETPLNGVSTLYSMQVTGVDGTLSESMPPITFKYTNYQPDIQEFKRLEGNDLPLDGLSSPNLTTVSLFGNGLPDILEVNGNIRYWKNLGHGRFDRPRTMKEAPAGLSLANPNVQLVDANGDGRVDMLVNEPGQAGYFSSKPGALWERQSFQPYRQAPSFGLADPNMKMVDLTGNGVTDVLYAGAKVACYFSDPIEGWTGARTANIEGYEALPNLNFADARVRMSDMSGDGMQDIVFIESGMVKYWPNLGYGNFAAPVRMAHAPKFPYDFDPNRIFLADVDGDGMDDVIYVDASRVLVWINQSGRGFSAPIEIKGTPIMTDPAGIATIDLLGNGTAGVLYSSDMLYQGRPQWYFLDLTGGVKPYLLSEMDNHMGAITRVQYKPSTHYYLKDNLTPSQRRDHPLFQDTASSGAVSSSPTAGRKSREQKRWETTLPFPVQVVSKTEVVDQLSLGKLSTTYDYHHGYWDGAEREFRGFGRVDTYDTEGFSEYNAPTPPLLGGGRGVGFPLLGGVPEGRGGLTAFSPTPLGDSGTNQANTLPFLTVSERHYSPPTMTRNWFNLGPVGGEFGDWEELTFSEEYWQEDPNVLKRPATTQQMLKSLPRRLQRDAIRTLRGNMLRSETYTYDQWTGPAARPFTVSESQQGIALLYKKEDAGKAVKGRYGIYFRPPGTIFFPHGVSSRSSQWEEGNDPLTTFSFTGDYDAYGQAKRSGSFALPRGLMTPFTDARGADANEPILGTIAQGKYIYKDTRNTYICNRQCRALSYEVKQTSTQNIFDLEQQYFHPLLGGVPAGGGGSSTSWEGIGGQVPSLPLNGGGSLNVLACALSYYDGSAFNGLSWGEIGDHGALVRTETLVVTEQQIADAYDSRPPCFESSPDWTAYPSTFQSSLQNDDEHLGFTQYTAEPYVSGWYRVDVKHKYDFQDAAIGHERGLLVQSKDLFENLSEIIYDSYAFLPEEARQYYDSSYTKYLSTSAIYDYRLLKPIQVNDENTNRTRFDYSPLGLLQSIALLGNPLKTEGDVVTNDPLVYVPSTRFEYNLDQFAEDGQPVWVKTIQRELHWQQDPTNDSPTIQKVEFSDGFGRVLQVRAQAEDTIFGDSLMGDSGLPVDQSQNADAVGHTKLSGEVDNVVVSGWKVYNNKGKVVEEYEPFFDHGYDYQRSPFIGGMRKTGYPLVSTSGSTSPSVDGLQKMTIRYDAAGRPTETTFPDGSKSLVVYGIPNNIGSPPLTSHNQGGLSLSKPTPWERYTYDQNDLSALTPNAGGVSSSPVENSVGAFTPKSERIDALGRTVQTTEHNSQPVYGTTQFEDVVMTYEYDIQGNLTYVKDPYDRIVFHYRYNLVKQALYTDHIDSGTSRLLPDALGKPIEASDAKGALTLSAYDILQRPFLNWSKDDSSASIRMNARFNYGEDITNDTGRNMRGKIYLERGDTGQTQFFTYDFKGNLLEKRCKVIKSSLIQAALTNYNPYRINWTSTSNKLDSRSYNFDYAYDALNRVTRLRTPTTSYGGSTRHDIYPHYNRAGALESITGSTYLGDFVDHIAYNAKGQRLLIAYNNGVMTRYAYDNKTFRLARQRSEQFTKTTTGQTVTYAYDSGTNKQDDGFNYDLVGNILKILCRKNDCGIDNTTLGANALDRDFTYDPMYRLTTATGRESDTQNQNDYLYADAPVPGSPNASNVRAYTRKYRYDKIGNIEQMKQVATGNTSNSFTRNFVYNTGVNTLQKVEDASSTLIQDFTYDSAGNQLTAGSTRYYEWDAANQLLIYKNQVGSNDPTIYTQYDYTPAGERGNKMVRTGTAGSPQWLRVIYFDGIYEHHTLETASDTYDKYYIHCMDGRSRISMVRHGQAFPDDIEPTLTNFKLYILEDQIGSSVVRLKTDASVIDIEEYYPFGDSSLRTFEKKRYRYVGKERDLESGLYYYGARYYAAWTCRFISVDPLAGKYADLSPYNYAGNRPIVAVDIDGLQDPNRDATPQSYEGSDYKMRNGSTVTGVTYEDEQIMSEALDKTGGIGTPWNGSSITGQNPSHVNFNNPNEIAVLDKSWEVAEVNQLITDFVYGLFADGLSAAGEFFMFGRMANKVDNLMPDGTMASRADDVASEGSAAGKMEEVAKEAPSGSKPKASDNMSSGTLETTTKQKTNKTYIPDDPSARGYDRGNFVPGTLIGGSYELVGDVLEINIEMIANLAGQRGGITKLVGKAEELASEMDATSIKIAFETVINHDIFTNTKATRSGVVDYAEKFGYTFSGSKEYGATVTWTKGLK